MNMISQLRATINIHGKAILSAEDYNQLQAEWIKRVGAEDMVTAARQAIYSAEQAQIEAPLRAEIDRLRTELAMRARGECICVKCGLRQDARPEDLTSATIQRREW